MHPLYMYIFASLQQNTCIKRLVYAVVFNPVIEWSKHPLKRRLVLNMCQDLLCLNASSVLPSLDNFIFHIQKCNETKSFASAKLAHGYACSFGLETHELVGNYLVPLFVNCGSLLYAQLVFEKLDSPNDHSWTSLIEGHMDSGDIQYAFFLFNKMQECDLWPNRIRTIRLLNACARCKHLQFGMALHSEIDDRTIEEDAVLGSSLVNMYAKCGSLSNASKVFDQMIAPDVVAWTSLIAGYAEYGPYEKVFTLIHQMELRYISPDPVTLVCGLKACARLGALHKGQEIHAKVIKKGFENDSFTGNSLVDLYLKCGCLVEAQNTFDSLPHRTSVSWNALITGYVDCQQNQKAFEYFQKMGEEGFCPDAATFVCVVRGCSSLMAIQDGQLVHSDILMKGFEKDLLVGSALVDMYAKCGFFSEAQMVLYNLRVRNTVSWNSLIAGYVDHGIVEEALKCFDKMQLDGISADAFTYASALKACGDSRDIDMIQNLHSKIQEEGYMEDAFVSSTLLDTYIKCNDLSKAQEVFDMLPERHVVAWSTLMSGYTEHGFGKEALVCYKQLQSDGMSPNAVTFMSALKACICVGDVEVGREVHEDVVMKGLDKDISIANMLIDMYIKCGSLIEANAVFGKILRKNVVSWTTLIAGHVEAGYSELALDLYNQMKMEGLSADSVTYFCILSACGSIGAIEKGQEIHAEMSYEGFESEPYVASSLVDMYLKCDYILEAVDVLEDLPHQDVVVWTAVIAGFSERGFSEEAWESFWQMQLSGICPDAVSWNAAMLGFVVKGETEKATIAFAQMLEQGLLPINMIYITMMRATGNSAAILTGKRIHALIYHSITLEEAEKGMCISLIEMYCKCGSSFYAEIVFNQMGSEDLAAWNALLRGYSIIGENVNALNMFEHKKDSIKPDDITFLTILNACCHEGLVAKGLEYFMEINLIYGMIPTLEHYNCIVDLLGRSGQLSESVIMVKIMPFTDAVTWSILLGACQRCGNRQLGRQVFDYALKLDLKGATAFVAMSNMYADTGISDMGQNEG